MARTKTPTPQPLVEEIELIKNYDAVIWSSCKNENEVETKMTFFKMPCKAKPTELGYKYNILVFRTPEDTNIGMFTAILGDPKGYIENVGRLGYHGIMFKDKIRSKKLLKELFIKLSRSWGFTELQIKKAIKIG